MPREPWREALRPWAEQFGRLVGDLDSHCRECDDNELQVLADAAGRPTSSNCWWAEFEVAALVRDAVKREQRRRIHAAREASNG